MNSEQKIVHSHTVNIVFLQLAI